MVNDLQMTRVSEMIACFTGVDASKINMDTDLKSLGIDAIGLVDIIMDIEDEFLTTIDDSATINTVGDIVKNLYKALELQSA